MSRRARAIAVVAVAATAATAISIVPLLASEVSGLTLHPFADTTVTQVPQDGDNGGKTTLASCPQLCDGNAHGRRDAALQFAVDRLPPGATRVTATLRVYAWHDVAARVVERTIPGDLGGADSVGELAAADNVLKRDAVTAGFNDFDVSGTVRGNGTYTLALSQETVNTRVYWASVENADPALRPQLVLSYTVAGGPTATPTTPATARPTPTGSPVTSAPSPSPTRAATAAPSTTPPTTRPPADAYALVWRDEFDGTSIDRTRWNVRSNEGRSVDQGCNTDSARNSFVSGGTLTLRALRETSVCSSQTRQYTQAYLDTIGLRSWTYGKFEMRAKSPNGPTDSTGLWPAFWLRPDDGGHGEIDVVELPGGKDWYARATQSIFYDYTPVKQDTRTALPGGGYPGDGFHTYTTVWEPGVLRWYLDGILVWTRDRSTTPWFDEAFSRPYNIRLNFQVGGWLGTPTAATAFPADFVVDYVRVYQR
jgi:beta-glucanase (GH16 family)